MPEAEPILNPFDPAPQVHYLALRQTADGQLELLSEWSANISIAQDTLETMTTHMWASRGGNLRSDLIEIHTANHGSKLYKLERSTIPGWLKGTLI